LLQLMASRAEFVLERGSFALLEHSLEVSGAPVGELINYQAEGVLGLCVLSADLGEVAIKYLSSGGELLSCAVALAVHGDELEELNLVSAHGGEELGRAG